MRFTYTAASLLVLAMAACAPQTNTTAPTTVSVTTPTGLPGGVVRTDGKSDVHMAFAGEATCTPASPAEAARALAATNSARAARGLAPMRLNAKAQQAAERHACDMARRGIMTHAGVDTTGPSARMKNLGYKPRMVAENIAAGAFSFDRAVSEWTNSPGHVANIALPGVSDFGVGYATAADGKSVFFAAVYAQPR